VDIVSEKLFDIIKQIDGATSGAFSGYDGIVIGKHDSEIESDIDSELMCANLASVLKILRSTGTALKDVIVTFEGSTVLIKPADDGFVCIVMNSDGNLGRARLECNRMGREFLD
jgi:predicted regulator of Ras-like GTPase activity (Roadblock/LC7/MglB family)